MDMRLRLLRFRSFRLRFFRLRSFSLGCCCFRSLGLRLRCFRSLGLRLRCFRSFRLRFCRFRLSNLNLRRFPGFRLRLCQHPRRFRNLRLRLRRFRLSNLNLHRFRGFRLCFRRFHRVRSLRGCRSRFRLRSLRMIFRIICQNFTRTGNLIKKLRISFDKIDCRFSQILFLCLHDCNSSINSFILISVHQSDFFTGLYFNRPGNSVLIPVSCGCCAFQNNQLGYIPIYAVRKHFKKQFLKGGIGLHQPPVHFLFCPVERSHMNNCPPDPDHHGGCLNIEALIFIQLFLHIQQQSAGRERQLHLVFYGFKQNLRHCIQRKNFTGVKANRSHTALTCGQTLSIVEPHIFHKETVFTIFINNKYIPFIVQKAHDICGIAFCRHTCADTQREDCRHAGYKKPVQIFMHSYTHNPTPFCILLFPDTAVPGKRNVLYKQIISQVPAIRNAIM